MAVDVSQAAQPHLTACSLGRGEAVVCPFPTVTAAFYHQVAAVPSHTAVCDLSGAAPRELTYAELAGHAQALARRLRGLGAGPGQRVPVVVKRGLEMVVGI